MECLADAAQRKPPGGPANSRTLQKRIDDIHLNPVRQGLVEQQTRDWKWSSAGWIEQRPLNDLEPDPIGLVEDLRGIPLPPRC